MLPEEVTGFIGKKGIPSIFEVEKEAIRRFADSMGDTNPLYWDEEYAKKSKYGSIIAPPGFISAPWFSGRPKKWGRKGEAAPDETAGVRPAIVRAGFGRILDGGIEYDFFLPVRAGDVLVATPTITAIREREGKGGNLIFCTTEIVYMNQNGNVVAKARSTVVGLE